jgi:hypothetical protein
MTGVLSEEHQREWPRPVVKIGVLLGRAAAGAGPGRFARDAAEYATATGIPLQVLDGGSDTAGAGS